MSTTEIVNKHKAKNIVIKKALIDEKMIPVVKWLNSYKDTHTTYCCEGEKDTDNFQPHCLFMCHNMFELKDILYKIYSFGLSKDYVMILVDFLSTSVPIRFQIKFKNQATLKLFCDNLAGKTFNPKYIIPDNL